jgi:uncharacterized protein YkwD
MGSMGGKPFTAMKSGWLVLCLIVAAGACSAGPEDEKSGRQWPGVDSPAVSRTGQAAQAPDLTTATSTAADSILQAVNVRRAVAGISPLILQSTLADVSYERSLDMAARGYLAHVDPADGSPAAEELLRAANFTGQAAELIFRTGAPVDGVSQAAVSAWFQDSDHKLVLLSQEFRYTGIGVVGDGDRWIVTMLLTGETP